MFFSIYPNCCQHLDKHAIDVVGIKTILRTQTDDPSNTSCPDSAIIASLNHAIAILFLKLVSQRTFP